MLQNGNKKYNNQMNRRQQQYQENDNYEEITSTPKQKIYQNAYNNMNNKNSNSIKNQNNRNNINSNTKMNRNNNYLNNNINNINNNNINRGIQNNINNINLNRGISNNKSNNNSDSNNNNINKAIIILKNEFKKKDDKIKLLELKVEELERKINMITNSKINLQQQNNNNNMNKNINGPFNKNFTFAELNSGEVNPFTNNNEKNQINTGMEEANIDNNNNVYSQNKSSNQFQINNNQYNLNNNNNLNQGIKENSAITGNSGSSRNHSKNEVKSYLKEVKEKVEPFIFKEFIKNIKLLTSSKENKGAIDRKKVVENVKILFGEQYKELYIKFEAIIGI